VTDTIGDSSDDGDFEVNPSKLLIKFGKPVLTYVWHWMRGYKLVLVGPPLGGKTRLLRFFYTLQLLPDHKNDYDRAADRTLEVSQHGLVVLRIGAGGRIVLPLRAVVDTPGRKAGELHADLIVDKDQLSSGAHAVVIVLDANQPTKSVEWITGFGKRLGTGGRTKLSVR